MRTQHRNTPPIPRYTPLAAALALALGAQSAQALTITVTDGRDDFISDPITEATVPRPGTLRAAITYLNDYTYINDLPVYNCSPTGGDVINFSGPFTITLSQPLPSLACAGLTIQGFGRTPVVQIVGNSGIYNGLYANYQANVNNLEVFGFSYGTGLGGQMNTAGNTVHDNDSGIDVYNTTRVDGNTVYANNYGIYVSDSYGGTVSGNKVHNNGDGIDIDYSGLTAANNIVEDNNYGIYVYSSSGMVLDHNTVRVSDSEATNIEFDYSDVVATNNTTTGGGYGFYAYQSYFDLNHNFVGTDATGASGLGNSVGIYVDSFSYGSISANFISGNTYAGIEVYDSDGLSITGNAIGTNPTDGTKKIANGRGISAYCMSASTIDGNTISGNDQSGVELYGVVGTEFGVTSGGAVTVTNNKIGVAGDGISALPNNAYGVYMGYGSCGGVASARVRSKLTAKVGGQVKSGGGYSSGVYFGNNTIAHNLQDGVGISGGSSNNFSGNVIRNNGNRGVFITSGTGNQIVQNSIYDNFGLNIDLAFGTPLLNDYGTNDADPGANNWQNFPDIASVVRSSGVTNVAFTLDSAVGNYRVDVYSNSSAVPGGKVWHGNTNVNIAVTGAAAGSFAISSTSVDNISLTATRADAAVPADTSEFSPIGFVQVTPSAIVSPTSVDFGNVAIGGRSADRTVTIQSNGTGAFVIDTLRDSSCYGGPICYGGPFVCSTDCKEGTPMIKGAAGGTCTITAAFAPTSLGSYSTRITLCDNSAVSPRDILITGNAVVPPPVSITPSSWNFGSVLVGKQSDAETFVVANPGTTSVPIGSVTTTGDFIMQATTCDTAIAAGDSCDATVVFAPTVQGPADGTLQVSAGGPPLDILRGGKRVSAKATVISGAGASASLTGLGTAEAVADLPASLDLGAQTLGEGPLTHTITLGSHGNRSLEIVSVTTSAPFSAVNNCPAILPPGNDCTIVVSYSSNVLGNFSGRLDIVSNSATGTGSVLLAARTVEVASALIRLSSTNMGFGDRLFGTPSPTQRVTIANIGNSTAVIASIATSNLDFLVSGTTCGAVLAAGAECAVDVAMRPIGFGPRTGLLIVSSNASGSPHQVSLVGTGCRPFTGAGAHSGGRNNCAP